LTERESQLAREPEPGLFFHRESMESVLRLVEECYDILFGRAPVMMQSID